MTTRATPEQRMQLHRAALYSEETKRGFVNNLQYEVLPKLSSFVERDDADAKHARTATSILAKIIYPENGDATFVHLQLRIFTEIRNALAQEINNGMVEVFIKGSAPVTMYLGEQFDSDLDIAVYINPALPKTQFDWMHANVQVIVGQVFASHKQLIDRTFFISRDTITRDQWLLDADAREAFRQRCIEGFGAAGLMSPLESDVARNLASSFSFSIKESLAQTDKVVRITEPHFDYAQKFPLHRSPIMCTVNTTVNFVNRDFRMHFDITRMKWMFLAPSDTEAGYKRLGAEFVDCVVPHQDDTELLEFWEARVKSASEPESEPVRRVAWFGKEVVIPTCAECMMNIWKMLFRYDSPEAKHAARMAKYTRLQQKCVK
ncbi:hypothetical protein FOA52_012827 [Chlamydomonas sp. UWO 241]|nr:hypothetical protein FOA52_012827 [Chlamydomonas sp. UWO 241]